MPNAKQLPSGKWRVLVYIGTDSNGKKKYKSITDNDKRRCERIAAEYADDYRQVRDSSLIGNAIEEFINARKAVLSPSTIRGYQSIRHYLKDSHRDFYERQMASLTKDVIQSLITDMVMEGATPKTIANRIGLINTVMAYKDYKMPNVKLPEKRKPDLTIPDTKDVQAIIRKAEGTEMEIPILLAAFGPLRRSEIVGLTMDDIEGNTIHVRKAVVVDEHLNSVEKTTKTYDSNRYIPMDKYIIDKINEKGCVTEIKNPHIISQRFEHIAKNAGCPGVRFHDLRHWCASYLHAQGVPDQYIMARGGWKTDRVMKAVYRHELISESNKWNRKINGLFESVMQ